MSQRTVGPQHDIAVVAILHRHEIREDAIRSQALGEANLGVAQVHAGRRERLLEKIFEGGGT